MLKGLWKLTWVEGQNGNSEWELFDLINDPGETNNLVRSRPDRLQEMQALWEKYATAHGVVLPEGGGIGSPWGDRQDSSRE